jgi:hypothetical protein
MKLAIAYSTKDQVELTKQTFLPLLNTAEEKGFHVFWCDGSISDEGKAYYSEFGDDVRCGRGNVRGGADAAIAWKLSWMLNAKENYTHIGLLENDVLLDADWLAPTLALFDIGKADGMDVGAVSPRSYVDRLLIQCSGYGVFHNLGAGAVIFTREAAEIVLRTFRTHWWPDNVRAFAQLSGVDLRTYAAFRGNEQFVTTDWGWEAQLARHGLAALALTPSKAQMVGQTPSLEEQGLELTTSSDPGPDQQPLHDGAFQTYRTRLYRIRQGQYKLAAPKTIHQTPEGQLFFPHQLGNLAGGAQWSGKRELKWSQGFGPFGYRAGPGGAFLSVRVSGSCSFLLTGGDIGATVTIEDTRSGFKFSPNMPGMMEQAGSINVPGGPTPRIITMQMNEGAVFYGVGCTDPQILDDSFRFDWQQLPAASGEAQ